MHRDMGQPSLAESLLPETLGHNERLERIAEAFDWDRFGRLLARVHSALEGRPSYPPLMMVKVLLLEQWYNLSDPQMEEALQDRISFRRFVGLGSSGRYARLFDDQPLSGDIGRAWDKRDPVQGAGGPTGRAGTGPEGRDVDGRHIGEGSRAAAVHGGPRRQESGRSRCGLDQDPPWEADPLRLQGASGCGRRHGAGAEGGAYPGQGL